MNDWASGQGPSIGRRRFITGAAAVSGTLLLGDTLCAARPSGRSIDKPLPSLRGRIFRFCPGPGGTILASATTCDGASVLEVFSRTGQEFVRTKEYSSTGAEPGELNYPQGLAFDTENTLYVMDCNNGRIQKFDRDLNLLGSIGRLGPKPGQFQSAEGICVQNDLLYVADTRNHRVQVLDRKNGAVLTVIGEHGDGEGFFRSPSDVAVSDEGFIFVADGGNGRIQVFEPFTGTGGGAFSSILPEPEFPGLGKGFELPVTTVECRGETVYAMASSALGRARCASARMAVYRRAGERWKQDVAASRRITDRLDAFERPYSFCLLEEGGIVTADLFGCKPVLIPEA